MALECHPMDAFEGFQLLAFRIVVLLGVAPATRAENPDFYFRCYLTNA